MSTLPELIEKCSKYLEQGHLLIEGKPETLTRQFLVEPLLEILGWSTDPATTYYYVREFSGGMDRKWEDYVLFMENRPLAFLETKPLFDVKAYTCECGTDFREYTLKGKHSFTLRKKTGKGFVKA